MRYYEIRDPYYALIPAKCKDDAISLYVEEIADGEYEELKTNIKQIAEIEAFIKFANALKDEFKTIGKTIDEFYHAHILLIDGSLR
ncbi:MAG: hypothetical protein GX974_03990 [Clostridiales bacterium]|nr:hypothetical protein [Clostridiales bacterium]